MNLRRVVTLVALIAPAVVSVALVLGTPSAGAEQDLTGIDPTGQEFTINPGEGFESIGIGGGVAVSVSADSGAGMVVGVNVTGVDYEFVCSDLERVSTGTVVTIGCDGDDITDSPGVMPVGLGCMEPPCTMAVSSLSGYPFAFIAGNILGAEPVVGTVVSYTPWEAPEPEPEPEPDTDWREGPFVELVQVGFVATQFVVFGGGFLIGKG